VTLRILALLLLVAVMLLLQRTATPDFVSSFRAISLALGFALLAATVLGSVVERIGLPRLTGYLLFGIICGPYALSLITPTMASQLQLVNGLAVALIAFIAGLELNLGRLVKRLALLSVFGGITIVITFVAIVVVLLAAWSWLPISPAAGGIERVALALLTATLIMSFSPTVTIAVIAESRARGPLSELVVALVILGDLALIFFFTLAMQFARVATGAAADEVGLLPRMMWEIVGSLAYGALIGALFAMYLRSVGRELTVVLLAMCVLMTGTAAWWHFELVLVALSAGIVVENIAPPRGDALRDAVENGALPVLVVFFVAAGASLHLDALAVVGPVALGLAVVRGVAIRAATVVGTRVTQLDPALGRESWKGLIAQAGVTLGLAAIVATEFPGVGVQIQTVIVALTAIHVIVGPILFRSALVNAGEVGVLDVQLEAQPLIDEAERV
jgi:Kef-type K+ transport system membrane component KefB